MVLYGTTVKYQYPGNGKFAITSMFLLVAASWLLSAGARPSARNSIKFLIFIVKKWFIDGYFEPFI